VRRLGISRGRQEQVQEILAGAEGGDGMNTAVSFIAGLMLGIVLGLLFFIEITKNENQNP
jgi:F0F1-type ATP synthase assembly protein I